MNKQELIAIRERPYSFNLPHKKPHPLEHRIVLQNYGIIDPLNIDHYIAKNGYFGLLKALEMTPENVIEDVISSGLRGRGGVGFSTGVKWKFTKANASTEKYIICNADEGEPGTFMDKHILEQDPHSVLEGMLIAGYAIGAQKGYIYLRAEYPIAKTILEQAIEQAEDYQLLGNNINGSGFDFTIEVRMGAGAFICGEETSLLESLEGKRGESRNKPPYPASKGLFQQPTVVNNVETLSIVPQIILNGSSWYAAIGTEKSTGTKVISVSGNVQYPGIYEVDMGFTLRQVIDDLCGGMKPGSTFHFAAIGGPSGGFLTSEHFDIPIDFDSLVPYDAILGSGGIIIMDQTDCILDILTLFMEFNKDESCGKCTPCREGTIIMYELFKAITSGQATMQTINEIKQLGRTMQIASLCGLGQAAPNPFYSALRYFEEDLKHHIMNQECPHNVCMKGVEQDEKS